MPALSKNLKDRQDGVEESFRGLSGSATVDQEPARDEPKCVESMAIPRKTNHAPPTPPPPPVIDKRKSDAAMIGIVGAAAIVGLVAVAAFSTGGTDEVPETTQSAVVTRIQEEDPVKAQPNGARRPSLADIASPGHGSPTTADSQPVDAIRKAVVQASVSVSGGTVSNAQRVVAQMNAGFRRCYQHGLVSNPDMSGSARVMGSICAGGEPDNVTATTNGTVSSDVADCIAARVRAARFDPPTGGRASFDIKISLAQEK